MKWLTLAALALLLAACAPQETMQVGAVLPLTGISAVYGEYPKEGMDLALEEINANGGIRGIPLEILYEDSESQPATGVAALQKLISANGVPLVLAGAASTETLAQAPIAEREATVLLASGSAAPSVRFAGDYIFRLKVSVDKEMEELMGFAYHNLSARRASVIYVQHDYGEGGNEFAQKAFASLGAKILTSQGFKLEERDFRSHLIKATEGDPDVIVLIGWSRNMGHILKQAAELGIETTFIAPAGTIGPEIVEIAGGAADGLIYTMEFDVASERSQTREFRTAFNRKYGKDPEFFAAMGYDAVKLTAMLLERCGEDADCLKQELYGVRDYEGASGTISFDDHGDVEKPMLFMTIENGRLYVPYGN